MRRYVWLMLLLVVMLVNSSYASGELKAYTAPGNITLNKWMQQQFKVFCVDSSGNEVPVTGQVTWSADSKAGTITQDGLFTATSSSGVYPTGVKATLADGTVAMARVEVVNAPKVGNYTFNKSWGNSAPEQLNRPWRVTTDWNNNIYVSDTGNNRIVVYDSTGKYLYEWGSYGSATGKFDRPTGIAVGTNNLVYVADSGNYRIQIFTLTGTFVKQITNSGYGNGEFGGMNGIALDFSNNIYVADFGKEVIIKFDSNGKFLSKWNGYGITEDQYWLPDDIAVDGQNRVYVLGGYVNDTYIQVFDSNGKFLYKWGTSGIEDDQIAGPHGITVDYSGNVYLAANSRIQVFSSSGKYLYKLGPWERTKFVVSEDFVISWPYEITSIDIAPNGNFVLGDLYSPAILTASQSGNLISTFGIDRKNGRFISPVAGLVDSTGIIYVSDDNKGSIQKFGPNGEFIGSWGKYGNSDGQFSDPWGMDFGVDGNIYIADRGNGRVQKLDTNGNFICKWETKDTDGQSFCPSDIVCDDFGNVYVVDFFGHHIFKYDSNGKFLQKWDGEFGWYSQLAADAQGNIYISGDDNSYIQKFDANGKFISKFGSPGSETDYDGYYYGMTIAPNGYIYAANYGRARVDIYSCEGTYIGYIGSGWSAHTGLIEGPRDVMLDNNGNLIVVIGGEGSRVQIFSPLSDSIDQIKSLPNGKVVSLDGQIVTAGKSNLGDCLYIESANRSSGIKVTGLGLINRNAVISITGVLDTVNGEREIKFISCNPAGSSAIKPLGMNLTTVGGGQNGLQEAPWGWRQVCNPDTNQSELKWTRLWGLNNIGLLVRVWGSVKSTDSAGRSFILDDGAGVELKCVAPSAVTLPNPGDFVYVTGISSTEKNTSGDLVPLLRLRIAGDITVVPK